MTIKRPRKDSRLAAARYQVDGSTPSEVEQAQQRTKEDRLTPEAAAGAAEIAIQQAMRRGDFDNLPGLGQPLPGLDRPPGDDWWIRRKIELEGLSGLGPPALNLRKESAGLQARIDAAVSEAAVRKLLEDFNARVLEARRQLLGGPPVTTAPRDIEQEVAEWRARREARRLAIESQREREHAALTGMSWRERWRARRGK
jgi:hypothetical protein